MHYIDIFKGFNERGEDEAVKNCVFFNPENVKIPVIGLDDLIKMKEKAGREVDLYDLKHLRKD
jgi:hypothetical protein